jgi:hypothetical protein
VLHSRCEIPENLSKFAENPLTRPRRERFWWGQGAGRASTSSRIARTWSADMVANPLLRPAPLTRARVYARSRSEPRRSRCPATVPAEIARHPGARGPLRGVALAACNGVGPLWAFGAFLLPGARRSRSITYRLRAGWRFPGRALPSARDGARSSVTARLSATRAERLRETRNAARSVGGSTA